MKLHLKILLVLIPLIVTPLALLGVVANDRIKANSEQTVLERMDTLLEQLELTISSNRKNAESNIAFFSGAPILRNYISSTDKKSRHDMLQIPLLQLFAEYNRAYPNYYEIRVILPDGHEDVRYSPTPLKSIEEKKGESESFIKMKNSDKKTGSFLFTNPDNGEKAFIIYKKIFLETLEEGSAEVDTILRGYIAITIRPSFIEQQIEKGKIAKEGFLFITDETGRVLFSPKSKGMTTNIAPALFEELKAGAESIAPISTSFMETNYIFHGKKIEQGIYLFGALPESSLFDASSKMETTFITILFLTIIATGLLVYAVSRHFILEPIKKLVDATDLIGEGKLDVRLNISSQDEIGQLAADFNIMAKRLKASQDEVKGYSDALQHKVEERTLSLRQRNQELSLALEELKTAQSHLVQSEKMVFLGELVAGVAHEINTPIGIGVTSASYLEGRTKEVIKQFDNSDLKKSHLEKFFSECQQCSSLILKNLNRTSSLIQSFKMVSADQTYDEVRKFNVKEYIEDIIHSLAPRIRKTPHNIEIICDHGIFAHNNPGAFAQVMTNLIMNSLIHAYENEEEGKILIEVSNSKKKVSVIYADDGRGIPKEHLTKIFNPFFTTKRGQGGTGLGLNIVYNIVYKTLGGKIHCKSKEGKGTTFHIEFPVENPFHKKV